MKLILLCAAIAHSVLAFPQFDLNQWSPPQWNMPNQIEQQWRNPVSNEQQPWLAGGEPNNVDQPPYGSQNFNQLDQWGPGQLPETAEIQPMWGGSDQRFGNGQQFMDGLQGQESQGPRMGFGQPIMEGTYGPEMGLNQGYNGLNNVQMAQQILGVLEAQILGQLLQRLSDGRVSWQSLQQFLEQKTGIEENQNNRVPLNRSPWDIRPDHGIRGQLDHRGSSVSLQELTESQGSKSQLPSVQQVPVVQNHPGLIKLFEQVQQKPIVTEKLEQVEQKRDKIGSALQRQLPERTASDQQISEPQEAEAPKSEDSEDEEPDQIKESAITESTQNNTKEITTELSKSDSAVETTAVSNNDNPEETSE